MATQMTEEDVTLAKAMDAYHHRRVLDVDTIAKDIKKDAGATLKQLNHAIKKGWVEKGVGGETFRLLPAGRAAYRAQA